MGDAQMICSCGGRMSESSWETNDGRKHWASTCNACGRYHRWPSSEQPTKPNNPRAQRILDVIKEQMGT